MLTLRTARALLTTWYAFMLAYRGEIFLWMVATCLPLIMMGIWMQAGATGNFPGLTEASAVRYFLAVFVVGNLAVSWVIYEFEHELLTGKLSPMLLQPLDPIFVYLARHLAEQLARLPFLVAIVALALWLYPAALNDPDDPAVSATWRLPDPLRCVGFTVALYGAFAFRFLLQHTLALGAFWFERVSAVEQLNWMFYAFLSGLLYPFEVLPEAAQAVLLWTPFPWLVWFPAQLLAAAPDALPPVTRGFATLTIWTAAVLMINRVLWRAGLKRYSAMGA